MHSPALIAVLAGLLVALAVTAALVVRARHRRAEEEVRLAADADIRGLARSSGWTLALHPSDALWYRITGASESGVRWELLEGAPILAHGVVAGPGARWSSDDVRFEQLVVAVLPTLLYRRMKDAVAGDTWDPSWSAATRPAVQSGQTVRLENAWLAERFTLVSTLPAMAQRLFDADVCRALERVRSGSFHLTLGFPNLRLSADGGGATPELLRRLVAAGVAVAERYRALERDFQSGRD